MTNVTQLPDLPILNIFHHLRLKDLRTIHHVYAPWKRLQEETFRSYRTLTVVLGSRGRMRNAYPNLLGTQLTVDPRQNYRKTKWTILWLEDFLDNDVSLIADLFPNVTDLQIVMHNATQITLEKVALLINLWAPQLSCLRGWISPNETNADWMLRLSPSATSLVTSLPGPVTSRLNLFCGRFTNLTRIWLVLRQFNLAQLIHCLSPLTALDRLELTVDNLLDDKNIGTLTLPALPSITTIWFHAEDDEDDSQVMNAFDLMERFQAYGLAHLFPAVGHGSIVLYVRAAEQLRLVFLMVEMMAVFAGPVDDDQDFQENFLLEWPQIVGHLNEVLMEEIHEIAQQILQQNMNNIEDNNANNDDNDDLYII